MLQVAELLVVLVMEHGVEAASCSASDTARRGASV